MFNILTPNELKEALDEDKELHLLDVREDSELAEAQITCSQFHHIPLGELAERHQELPADKNIAVVCRSGGRSSKACEYLIGKKYKVANVEGGMLAWAKDIDPTLKVK